MPVPAELDDPLADRERLRALGAYDLRSERLEAELCDLARTTAEYVGRPIGLVSVVLDSSQRFVGRHGLGRWLGEAAGTPIEWSFCAHPVRRRQPYVVVDASEDPDHRDNPLVTIDGIRSYAGTPIVDPDGHGIGAVCVLGPDRFEPTERDLEQLAWSARQALAVLGRHRRPSLG